MRFLASIIFIIAWVMSYGALSTLMMLGEFDRLLALLIMPVLVCLCIVAHEAGHAIAATLAGAQVQQIAVVALRWDVSERRVTWRGRNEESELGGFVLYTIDRANARWRAIAIAVAGPAANLMTGLIALALMAGATGSVVPRPPEPSVRLVAGAVPHGAKVPGLPSDATVRLVLERTHPRPRWPEALAVAFGILSLALALSNMLPFAGSDGQAILRALRPQRRST